MVKIRDELLVNEPTVLLYGWENIYTFMTKENRV